MLRDCLLTSPLGSRISNQSSKSLCSILRLTLAAPRLTDPWFVASIVESYILQKGTTPSDVPLPFILAPAGLIWLIPIPTPPPCLASNIISKFLDPMSNIESATSIPKQLIGSPRSVPVLDSTGDAKHNQPFHMYSKNLSAISGRSRRLATALATRSYASRGVSSCNK